MFMAELFVDAEGSTKKKLIHGSFELMIDGGEGGGLVGIRGRVDFLKLLIPQTVLALEGFLLGFYRITFVFQDCWSSGA